MMNADEWNRMTDEAIIREFATQAHPDPEFFAWVRLHRPWCMRQYLHLHRESGGYLGRPARRFLRDG